MYMHLSEDDAPCAHMKCFPWLHTHILALAAHPSTHSQLEVASYVYPVLQTGSHTTGDLINTYTYTLSCTLAMHLPVHALASCD